MEKNKPGQFLNFSTVESFIDYFGPLFAAHRGEILMRIVRNYPCCNKETGKEVRKSDAVTETSYWLAAISERGLIRIEGRSIVLPCGSPQIIGGEAHKKEFSSLLFGDDDISAMSEGVPHFGYERSKEVPRCELMVGDAAVASSLSVSGLSTAELLAIFKAMRLLGRTLQGCRVLDRAVGEAAARNVSWLYNYVLGIFQGVKEADVRNCLAELAELGIDKEKAIERVLETFRERVAHALRLL